MSWYHIFKQCLELILRILCVMSTNCIQAGSLLTEGQFAHPFALQQGVLVGSGAQFSLFHVRGSDGVAAFFSVGVAMPQSGRNSTGKSFDFSTPPMPVNAAEVPSARLILKPGTESLSARRKKCPPPGIGPKPCLIARKRHLKGVLERVLISRL